jgi:hypothetical protein
VASADLPPAVHKTLKTAQSDFGNVQKIAANSRA